MAVAITTGAAIFKLNEESHAPVKNTQLIGIVLIAVYMGTDSFTSNWQSRMFKQYGVTSMVMMLYANLFSSVRREDANPNPNPNTNTNPSPNPNQPLQLGTP